MACKSSRMANIQGPSRGVSSMVRVGKRKNNMTTSRRDIQKIFFVFSTLCAFAGPFSHQVGQAETAPKTLSLSRADYVDRAEAIWTAQIIACALGWQFE